jgi:hypothetical protein
MRPERPNRKSEGRIAPSTFQGLAKRGEKVPHDESGRLALNNRVVYRSLDEKPAAEDLSRPDVADPLGPGFSAAKLKRLDGGPGVPLSPGHEDLPVAQTSCRRVHLLYLGLRIRVDSAARSGPPCRPLSGR